MHTSYFTRVALPLCLTALGVDSHSNPCQNMPHTWQADVTWTLTPKRWVTTVPAAVSRTTGSNPKTSIPVVCHNLNSVSGLRVSKKRTAIFFLFSFHNVLNLWGSMCNKPPLSLIWKKKQFHHSVYNSWLALYSIYSFMAGPLTGLQITS